MKAAWWCVAALFAATLVASSPALAMQHLDNDEDEEEALDRNRFYFGLGPLYGVENFRLRHQNANLPAPTGGLDANVDQSYGAEARAGYRFHPHLAVELQGQYNGDFDVHTDAASPVGSVELGSVRLISSTANLKAYMVSDGPVQPYALGGVGILWADTDDRVAGSNLPHGDVEFAGRGGLGVDFYLSPMVAFYVEGTYLAPTGSLARFGNAAIAAGAQWHF